MTGSALINMTRATEVAFLLCIYCVCQGYALIVPTVCSLVLICFTRFLGIGVGEYCKHRNFSDLTIIALKTWSDYKTITAANQKQVSSLWRPANTDQQLAFSSHLSSPSSGQNHRRPLKLGSVVLFPDLVILV